MKTNRSEQASRVCTWPAFYSVSPRERSVDPDTLEWGSLVLDVPFTASLPGAYHMHVMRILDLVSTLCLS